MKVVNINLKAQYKKGIVILKIISFLLLVIITSSLSASAYITSDAYMQTLCDVTEKSTIIIDAGHGGEDCGAIGVSGVYEKDLNLSIATILGELLTEKGYAVIYTRTEDALLYTEEENIHGMRKISDLKNRCKIGAEYKNSIYISIHMNSYKSSSCNGLQVYFSENNASSQKLASKIQSSVKENLQPQNNRNIKYGKGIYLLENLTNPAVLIECGFLTNPTECENLSKKEYQKELSSAIFCGIIEYINEESRR